MHLRIDISSRAAIKASMSASTHLISTSSSSPSETRGVRLGSCTPSHMLFVFTTTTQNNEKEVYSTLPTSCNLWPPWPLGPLAPSTKQSFTEIYYFPTPVDAHRLRPVASDTDLQSNHPGTEQDGEVPFPSLPAEAYRNPVRMYLTPESRTYLVSELHSWGLLLVGLSELTGADIYQGIKMLCLRLSPGGLSAGTRQMAHVYSYYSTTDNKEY